MQVPIVGKDCWMFRKPSSVQDACGILLHPMQGKVLDAAASKAKAKAKARPKRNAKAKARPTCPEPTTEMLPEPSKLADNIMVDCDGLSVSRTKYFLDCLIGGVRNALLSARLHVGVPSCSSQIEPPYELGMGRDGQQTFYMEHEATILQQCVGLGLTFALKGQVTISGKVFKRWSSCRPQLQIHAMNLAKGVS